MPEEPRKFASTQLDISSGGYTRTDGSPIPLFEELSTSIPDDELAEDGKETDFHVTTLYGLHANDAEEVKQAVAGFGPLEIEFGELSFFPSSDDGKPDVLKIDISGDDIHRLNKILRKLDHTNDYPDYKPHATIAYLKAGSGEKYVGKNPLTGKKMNFDCLYFMGKDRNETKCSFLTEKYYRQADVIQARMRYAKDGDRWIRINKII